VTHPNHIRSDGGPEDEPAAWWEDTLKLSQEAQLPEEPDRAAFLEKMKEEFAREAVREFMRAISELECRFILQMVAPVLEMPPEKLKAFVWSELRGQSSRQIALVLGVDHKTVIKWCDEVRTILSTPHWGAANQSKSQKGRTDSPQNATP
jgi:DNA-directed RNA polymerase specialized sigma24 family protein